MVDHAGSAGLTTPCDPPRLHEVTAVTLTFTWMRIPGVRALVNELELRLPANSKSREKAIAGTAASPLPWHSAIPQERI
jgi:hypothetical protein